MTSYINIYTHASIATEVNRLNNLLINIYTYTYDSVTTEVNQLHNSLIDLETDITYPQTELPQSMRLKG